MARTIEMQFRPEMTVFRIDWKGLEPVLTELTVSSCDVAAVELIDSRGKRVTLSTRPEFRQLSQSVEEAVCLAFRSIADDVCRHGGDAKTAILKTSRLAKFLAR